MFILITKNTGYKYGKLKSGIYTYYCVCHLRNPVDVRPLLFPPSLFRQTMTTIYFTHKAKGMKCCPVFAGKLNIAGNIPPRRFETFGEVERPKIRILFADCFLSFALRALFTQPPVSGWSYMTDKRQWCRRCRGIKNGHYLNLLFQRYSDGVSRINQAASDSNYIRDYVSLVLEPELKYFRTDWGSFLSS